MRSLDYSYLESEMKVEFKHLQESSGSFERNCNTNKIVLTFQPHFYKKEKELWNDLEVQKKLLENRCKYLAKDSRELTDKEILRGFKISGIHIGFSQHSYYWIKAFITKYKVKSIYDPCGGWGHRLIGAESIKYIYNDTDIDTFNGVKLINDFLQLKDKYFYNIDAAKLIPNEDYEAIFTCPPYFNLEEYNGELSSTRLYPNYSNWLNIWWYNVVKNSLKKSVKYFSFIINKKYKEDMIEICKAHNLSLFEEIIVGSSENLSHFHRTNKVSKNVRESLLIFINSNYKGDVYLPEKRTTTENNITEKEIKDYWKLHEKMKKAGLVT